MAADELKRVEEIYRFLRQWESAFPKKPDLHELEQFKIKLSQLSGSSKTEIKHLAKLASHLHQDLSAKELFTFLVPLERTLQKSLRDDEFMISEGDQPKIQPKIFPLILVLENIRSAFNVGAFFRTAEALGAQEIILCGYTPTPQQEKTKKTTMGTEAWIPWQTVESTEQALRELKGLGFRVIGLETSHQAQPITETFFHVPTAFVFGNERFGLQLTTLQNCDEIRKIELLGQKNSLNVAQCGAIVCHEWIRQWTNIS